jgi:hypothetical protein
MTRNIHQFLRTACFVRCRNPAHHERGYTLKHHKNEALIQVFFNSFELLNEAEQILSTQGIKAVKSVPHQSKGCFRAVELNQDPQQ